MSRITVFLLFFRFKINLCCVDSDQEWLGSPNVREEMELIFTSGSLVHTNPELFQQISSKFLPLPVDRFKDVAQEFWWPPEDIGSSLYHSRREPRLSALNYFAPTPRDQSAAPPVQFPIACTRRQYVKIQFSSPNLASTPNLDSASIRDAIGELISNFPNGLPPIDGDDAETYFNLIAQREEMFSKFDSESYIKAVHETDPEDFTEPRTPIDDLIGDAPKRPDMVPLVNRIDSFNKLEWRQLPLFRSNNPDLTPEAFACAGFYAYCDPTEPDHCHDLMRCFWCGTELDARQPTTDKPWRRHVYTSPTCPWVFRNLGRYGVRTIYMSKLRRLQPQPLPSTIYSTDTAEFLRGIGFIAGTGYTMLLLADYSYLYCTLIFT